MLAPAAADDEDVDRVRRGGDDGATRRRRVDDENASALGGVQASAEGATPRAARERPATGTPESAATAGWQRAARDIFSRVGRESGARDEARISGRSARVASRVRGGSITCGAMHCALTCLPGRTSNPKQLRGHEMSVSQLMRK